MRIYVKSQWNCTKLNGFKLLQTSQFSRPFPSSFFSFFFLPFLYLWIKNTRRHHRRCWIFPVQNVYRSVNKLRRGQRDVITRQSQIHVTRQGNVGLRIPPHNWVVATLELGYYNWTTQDWMLWYYWPEDYGVDASVEMLWCLLGFHSL